MGKFDVTDLRSVKLLWITTCNYDTLWGGNDIGNSKTACGLLIHQMKVAFAHILFEITWYRNYLVEYVAKTEVANFT
jgi:hypothetical protein